ncbi:SRPBCC family protein [Streptomyces sp. HNM0663]|uniref:SRPBCC family protein n=1 Tax=Streptomyces chengmaiensis TaxID=3040919 RepID=A0ABT6HXL2_9ACTN|nr:SRPBCC family protein [Streptomyces chengmaiensis]MDH2393076.1 SRPBCC family protein [Streptomyces chengmaiensis]
MSAIKETIEIDRRPEDVFSYVTDPSHLPEWQENAVAAEPAESTPPAVGSTFRVTRRIGGREIAMTTEVDEMDPPRSWTLRGVDGPVRGMVHGTVEPLGEGDRSRVTISVDFEGHGIGKLLVPLVARPQVRRELPRNEQHLKGVLERSG